MAKIHPLDILVKDLPLPEVALAGADCPVDTAAYEEEIARRIGTIGDDRTWSGGYKRVQSFLNDECLRFRSYGMIPTKEIRDHISGYESIEGSCAMKVDSVEDLSKHLVKMMALSQAHFTWGTNFLYNFPSSMCGSSSCNMQGSLLRNGYPNAAIGLNQTWDHCYLLLPFACGETNGTILLDPTAEQLWKYQTVKPKNAIRVITTDTWDYRTDWRGEKDLYPELVIDLGVVRDFLEHIERRSEETGSDFKFDFEWLVCEQDRMLKPDEFFDAAYNNAIDVKQLLKKRSDKNET